MRVALLAAAAAALLVSCGDLDTGASGTVVEAHVVRVVETGQMTVPGTARPEVFQRLEVELDSSLYRGERATVEWDGNRGLDSTGLLRPGDRVLLDVTRQGTARTYTVREVARLPQLWPLAALLVVALLAVARSAGLAALAGIAASVGVLLVVFVPALRGGDLVVAAVVASVVMLLVTVVATSGLGRASVAALAGAGGGLVVVGGLGAGALAVARISGFTGENTAALAAATGTSVDLARVALAAVVVGPLGALVAMAVGQAHATLDLAAADPALRGAALYGAALRAGRRRVASLLTMFTLASVGAALPLVLLLAAGSAPFAVALNGEELTLSVVTVLVASVGLVVCAPLATAAAVALAGGRAGG